MSKFLVLFFGFGLLLQSNALAQSAVGEIPIPNFSEVRPGVYRGGRPGAAGLKALKSLGVHTIINIDNDEASNAQELDVARKLNLRMIAQPMSAFSYPQTEQVDKILNALADENNYPVFIHCQHGQDRTGMIVGLYRVEHQKWAPKDAYNEMLKLGFHWILWQLKGYFDDRTGLEPEVSEIDPVIE